MPITLTEADLQGHNGVNRWLYNNLAKDIWYSSGLSTVFEKGEAYWLLTDIIAHIKANPAYAAACQTDPNFDYMNFWTLTVHADKSATLICQKDSNLPPVITQQYSATDFPLPELKIYGGHDDPNGPRLLYLPSEY